MSKLSRKVQSCDSWKQKAIIRANENRNLRKEVARLKADRNDYKQKLKNTEIAVHKLEQATKIPMIQNKIDLMYIALQLFLHGRTSFRAVSRVLEILSKHLGLSQTPCPQTIINWVIRLSIARMKYCHELVAPKVIDDLFSNGFIWMMDMSIGLNNRKIFTVVALKALHYETSDTAPSLHDIHCIAVVVEPSWNGEAVAECLQKLIAILGRPVAILKDGGKDLAKAIDLIQAVGILVPTIDDISHIVANLLKHEYCEHPLFAVFLSAVGKVSKGLKQTILACLAPPKTIIKARFMNVHKLFKWADKLLQHSPPGRAYEGSALAKLRKSLDQLPECKELINRFNNDAGPLLKCQELLKNKGLSFSTLEICMPIIEQIQSPSVRKGFLEWCERHLKIAKNCGLATTGMPITSDAIESLFGVAKQHGTGEICDANRIALRLPALCGQLNPIEVSRVLEITVEQQNNVVSSFTSITKQRREVLPTPGLIEILSTDEYEKNICLFPESKNRQNYQGNPLTAMVTGNQYSPAWPSNKITKLPSNTELSRSSLTG